MSELSQSSDSSRSSQLMLSHSIAQVGETFVQEFIRNFDYDMANAEDVE